MPRQGRYYKVEGIPKEIKRWYKLKDEVRAGTIVKCLENHRTLGAVDKSRIAVQLYDGSIRYVCAFQLETPVNVSKKN